MAVDTVKLLDIDRCADTSNAHAGVCGVVGDVEAARGDGRAMLSMLPMCRLDALNGPWDTRWCSDASSRCPACTCRPAYACPCSPANTSTAQRPACLPACTPAMHANAAPPSKCPVPTTQRYTCHVLLQAWHECHCDPEGADLQAAHPLPSACRRPQGAPLWPVAAHRDACNMAA